MINVAKKGMLWLTLLVACAYQASAQIPDASENRAPEIFLSALESRPVEAVQVLGLSLRKLNEQCPRRRTIDTFFKRSSHDAFGTASSSGSSSLITGAAAGAGSGEP